MLRIEIVAANGHPVMLKIHGRLVGPWIAELERTCERILADGTSPLLDLGGLSFADDRGVALLQTLSERHISLLHCSAFVAEQMRAATR